MVSRQLSGRGITDERVLAAMAEVPRELFVPVGLRKSAYRDGALRIGEGQTISQPWIVAVMAQLLELRGGERVLAAMRTNPELVGGGGQADTELMRALPGWAAKGGAEGLMCATGDGIAVAVKFEDGIHRGMKPALHAIFGRIGLELPEEFARVPVRNAHGEEVGEIVSAT